MDDATLRATYARLMAARGEERAACPDAEVLQRLATTAVVPEASAGAFDHVMGCTACRDEYELLRAIHRAGAPATAVATRRWAPLALAASALLAVGLGSAVVLRREATRGTNDGVQLVPPAGAPAASAPLPLAWRPVAGATAYRAELLDESGAPLFSTTTADTMVTVPGGTLPTGTVAVDWLVIATRADGSQQRSTLLRLTVSR